MSYDHTEWLYDSVLVAKTVEAAQQLQWFGIGLALLSTFHNPSTILFAMVSGQHIFSNVIQFVNHNYLFFLLSTLMALQCNCQNNKTRNKNKNDTDTDTDTDTTTTNGWIQALRGQIVVVYFYAMLWKFDRDWIDGTICKGIFLSFEETNENRGVPWSELYRQHGMPLFMCVALGGLVLDAMLFFVLMFLPPGHKLQAVCVLFHGFTGYTMSQRIGYSFPLAMIFSILLFQSQRQSSHNDDTTTTTTNNNNDTLSHAQWLLQQMTGGTDFDHYHRNNDDDHSITCIAKTNDDINGVTKKKQKKIHTAADTGDDNKNKNNDNGGTSSNDSAIIDSNSIQTTTMTTTQRRRQKRHVLPLLWLLVQWLIPIRMPFISNREYKYNFEGNRWSWT